MRKKFLILLLLIVMIGSSVIGVMASFSRVGVTSDRNTHFAHANRELGILASKSSYPVKADTSQGPTFTRLGYDILLGTKRNLVYYSGEVPNNYKDENGFGRFPYSTIEEYDKGGKVEWWGSEDVLSVDAKTSISELEKFAGEGGDVVSLRLYALTKTAANGFIINVGNFFYTATRGLCHIVAKGLEVFVRAKNITIGRILNDLGLSTLTKIFAKVFVKNGNNLSVFMILALVSFTFVVVGFAMSYARGKSKGGLGGFIKDILVVFLIGLTLAYMSLNSNISSIGTTWANGIANSVSELSVDSVEGSGIWRSAATGMSNGDSTVTSYNEISMINKTLIDLQIMAQFGVDNINELNITKLNGGSSITKVTGDGLWEGECDLSSYGNNLGYYYWYANSASPNPSGTGDTALFEGFKTKSYESGKTDARLEGVITYLQQAYNNASDDATKGKILSMVDNLANPSPGAMSIVYLLLTLEYILLILCLFQLVWRIVFSKIMCAGGILSLSIAGPMIISGRKKLVSTGKSIALAVVIYSIQVFILSVIFDLFLIIINTLIKPNALSIFLIIALTVALFIFLPNLMNMLDKLFADINGAIGARNLTNIQRRVKSSANGMFTKLGNSKFATRDKVIKRKDANGNMVYETVSKKTLLGAAAAVGVGATVARRRHNNLTNLAGSKYSRADKKSKTQSEFVKQYKENGLMSLNDAVKYKNYKLSETMKNGQLNREALIDSEKDRFDKIAQQMAELESATKVKFEIDKIKRDGQRELTKDEKSFLESYAVKQQEVAKERGALIGDVNDRINREVKEKYGEAINRELDNAEKTLEREISSKGRRSKEATDALAEIRVAKRNVDAGIIEKVNVSKQDKLEAAVDGHVASASDRAELYNIRGDSFGSMTRQQLQYDATTVKEKTVDPVVGAVTAPFKAGKTAINTVKETPKKVIQFKNEFMGNDTNDSLNNNSVKKNEQGEHTVNTVYDNRRRQYKGDKS